MSVDLKEGEAAALVHMGNDILAVKGYVGSVDIAYETGGHAAVTIEIHADAKQARGFESRYYNRDQPHQLPDVGRSLPETKRLLDE